MQVNVEEVSPVQKRISIEIPAERVDAEIDKVYANIQKKAKLQGFRPGKAPMQLIKRSYSDAMREEVMRRFFEQTLYQAIDEHKLEPVDAPVVESDPLVAGSPFKYSALVEVMPQILLNDYEGLAVNREKYAPSPAAIEGELKRMQENMAQLAPEEDGTAVENGHVVILDYTFSVDGIPEEDSSEQDAQVEVGANRLLPGFESQLVGMKVGENREISITLPDEYRNPQAAGKQAVFSVTLKEVKRKELPELDDEFAQQFGEYETLEDLRAKMSEYREKHETDRIAAAVREQLVKALVEKNPLDVPESMVKRQLEVMLETLKNRLSSQRMTMETMGLNEEEFRTHFREAAVEKVKGGLLLMALVEKENISSTEQDLEQRYEKISGGNPDMLTRVRDYYASNRQALNALHSEIKEEKAIELLLQKAAVTEVEPQAVEE